MLLALYVLLLLAIFKANFQENYKSSRLISPYCLSKNRVKMNFGESIYVFKVRYV